MIRFLLNLNIMQALALGQQFPETAIDADNGAGEGPAATALLSDVYSASFDASACRLTVTHVPSQTEIYGADARNIIQTGRSNIDKVASQVISDGNLAKEPTV